MTFGCFEGQPIKSRAIEQRGRMRMLLAEKPVTHRPFNDTPTDTSWKGCDLRAWLDREFLEVPFTTHGAGEDH